MFEEKVQACLLKFGKMISNTKCKNTFLWSHFRVYEKDDTTAVCHECFNSSKPVNIIIGPSKSASKIQRHLKLHHFQLYEQLKTTKVRTIMRALDD